MTNEFLSFNDVPTLDELHEYRSRLYDAIRGNNGDMIKHFGCCIIALTKIIILVKHCGVHIEDEIRYYDRNRGTFIANKESKNLKWNEI